MNARRSHINLIEDYKRLLRRTDISDTERRIMQQYLGAASKNVDYLGPVCSNTALTER